MIDTIMSCDAYRARQTVMRAAYKHQHVANSIMIS